MPDLVKISAASLEYQAMFKVPNINFISSGAERAFEAIMIALLPYGLRLANVDTHTFGKPADRRIIFSIPEHDVNFQVGAEGYKFVKESVSWRVLDEYKPIMIAAEQALLEGSAAKIGACTATIAMHLQPLVKSREEILEPFVPEPFRPLIAQRKADRYGNHLKLEDGDLLLDFSLVFANGIFLKFSRQFSGHPPIFEALAQVQRDQEAVFKILGVEEIVNG
ncbi:hypothetical protein [Candidatus Cyanaurora vandensis]|uniref:hypothetical protein n=1 Tax=Candidatus Cyanaurora vandensis TaxID=2714958 RepID=UPI00257BA24A|nr:hypothetical protein [Candidatus Cyanaurora vandensis]